MSLIFLRCWAPAARSRTPTRLGNYRLLSSCPRSFSSANATDPLRVPPDTSDANTSKSDGEQLPTVRTATTGLPLAEDESFHEEQQEHVPTISRTNVENVESDQPYPDDTMTSTLPMAGSEALEEEQQGYNSRIDTGGIESMGSHEPDSDNTVASALHNSQPRSGTRASSVNDSALYDESEGQPHLKSSNIMSLLATRDQQLIEIKDRVEKMLTARAQERDGFEKQIAGMSASKHGGRRHLLRKMEKMSASHDRKLDELKELLGKIVQPSDQETTTSKVSARDPETKLSTLLKCRVAVPVLSASAIESDYRFRFQRLWAQIASSTGNNEERVNALAILHAASRDPETLCIYTDGAAGGNNCAAAAVVLSKCNVRVKCLVEAPFADRFRLTSRVRRIGAVKLLEQFGKLAETEAILLALRSAEALAEDGQTVLIFTDSQAHSHSLPYDIEMLRPEQIMRHRKMVEILERLQKRNVNVETSWISKDAGVFGNIAAHRACRLAARTLLAGEEKIFSESGETVVEVEEQSWARRVYV